MSLEGAGLVKGVTTAAGLSKGLLLHGKVAWAAARWAKTSGINVSSWKLWLLLERRKVIRALHSDDQASRAVASGLVGQTLRNDSTQAERDALMEAVLQQYVRLSSAGNSNNLVRQETKHDDSQRQDTVVDLIQRRNSNEPAFHYRVDALHPQRAAEARLIVLRWPAMAIVALDIIDARHRPSLLADWANVTPQVLDHAPADVWAWLGEMAEAVRSDAAASSFYEKALTAGISPRGYWKMRRLQVMPASDVEAQRNYLDDVAEFPWASAFLRRGNDESSSTGEILASWSPHDSDALGQKLVVQARLALGIHDFRTAIDLGRRAWDEARNHNGGMIAAKAMVNRNAQSNSSMHANDLTDALDLYLEIRDRLRDWEMPSGAAVAEAVIPAELLRRFDTAWRITQPSPDGEATESEASHVGVLAAACRYAARHRRNEDVARLLPRIKDPFVIAEVKAWGAEQAGDSDLAVTHWREALEATGSWDEKIPILWSLAGYGIDPVLPDQLALDNPGLVKDLRLMAGLQRRDPQTLADARTESGNSKRIAMSLFTHFNDTGAFADAYEVAIRAAAKWEDSDLWLYAARNRAAAGYPEESIQHARAALLCAPSGWGGRLPALVNQAEQYGVQGDWESANKVAEQVLGLQPNDPASVWMLVTCRSALGNTASAHDVWSSNGRPRPRNLQETSLWIRFFHESGELVGSVQEALEYVEPYRDKINLRSALVSALLLQPTASTADDKALVRSALERYFTDFPDDAPIRRIDASGGDLVKAIGEAVGPAPDVSGIVSDLESHKWPLGAASAVVGSSYAHVIVQNPLDVRFAVPVAGVDEKTNVREALRSKIVIDTTALYTLTLLDEVLASRVFGGFDSVLLTASQSRDAFHGNDAVKQSIRSALSSAAVSQNRWIDRAATPDLFDRQRARAEGITRWAARTQSVHHPTLRAVAFGRGKEADPWLAGADLAASESLPFWCDDVVLRHMAHEAGALVFGTPTLLAVLREDAVVDPDLVDLAEATLLTDGFVGIEPKASVWATAIQLDGNQPLGTASALAYSGTFYAAKKLDLIFDAMSVSVSDPTSIRHWAVTASRFITYGAEDPKLSMRLLTVFIRQLLDQPWITSATLPFVVAGFAFVTGDELNRPLVDAIWLHYRGVVVSTDEATALILVRELVSGLDDAVRLAVLERVLAT